MKIWIILISLMASTLTWVWGTRRLGLQGRSSRTLARLLFKSIGAGVAVYFTLMAVALAYLSLTA